MPHDVETVSIDDQDYNILNNGQEGLQIQQMDGAQIKFVPYCNDTIAQTFHTLMHQGSFTILITSRADDNGTSLFRTSFDGEESTGWEQRKDHTFVCEVFRGAYGLGIIVEHSGSYRLLWFKLENDGNTNLRSFSLMEAWDPSTHRLVLVDDTRAEIYRYEGRLMSIEWKNHYSPPHP